MALYKAVALTWFVLLLPTVGFEAPKEAPAAWGTEDCEATGECSALSLRQLRGAIEKDEGGRRRRRRRHAKKCAHSRKDELCKGKCASRVLCRTCDSFIQVFTQNLVEPKSCMGECTRLFRCVHGLPNNTKSCLGLCKELFTKCGPGRSPCAGQACKASGICNGTVTRDDNFDDDVPNVTTPSVTGPTVDATSFDDNSDEALENEE
uniref:Uncharacterized protein n=1 Tax=Alexandrium andersonii TaxID=327968 RepID=A0A7S2E585_9DINO